ncbi:importin subunit alpha-6 [Manis javanica]|uniref:importin subunit alpha-6 n=1 Tax=Manis javanica TaxID=9974 RepID=UPI003C6D0973
MEKALIHTVLSLKKYDLCPVVSMPSTCLEVSLPPGGIMILGLDKIKFLQSHESQEIYQKAFDLIEHCFGVKEDPSIVPQVNETKQQLICQQ